MAIDEVPVEEDRSQESLSSADVAAEHDATPVFWQATWIAGPDAGGSLRLDPGVHVVGRSALAAVRCGDVQLEPFHLEVTVGDRCASVVQLAGRLPMTVDGVLVDGPLVLDGDRHTLDVGASRLVLDRRVHAGECPPLQLGVTVSGRRSVVRRSRVVPIWEPPEIPIPVAEVARGGFSGSILPALLALAGSGVIVLVLDQPMFLLFGALGAVIAISTWAAQRVGLVRSKRRSRREAQAATAAFLAALEEQRAAYVRYHRVSVGTLTSAVATARRPDASLWARRATHPDPFTVALGLGEVTWQLVLAGDERSLPSACWTSVERARTLADEAVPVTVGCGAWIAVCGPHGAAVVSSLVAQLAVQAGPADWRLLVVTELPQRWQHWADLPHTRDGSGALAILDEQGVAERLREARADAPVDERQLVVVVDDVRVLSARTSPTRRLLAAEPSAALLAVVAAEASVPAVCTGLLVTSADGRASWTGDTTTGELPRPLRLAGLSVEAAISVATALSGFADPEDPADSADALVGDVPLASLLGDTRPAAIAAAWAAAGADVAPETPVGVAADGIAAIDLVRDGPHALLAGTTGAGKSELLRSLVAGLATRLSPEQVNFVLVDYKGGAAFDGCAPLPHVVGLVTDLDGKMTDRVLRSLRAELTRREHLMRDHGASDLAALRSIAGRAVMPRLVVVVDEFAAMAVEHADLLHALIGVAQRGRSLGVHLVLATQRPAGVISDDIRANTNLRVALRLPDTSDSMDVIGDPSATQLPRHRPGRALMRLGPDELITFQSAHQAEALVPALVEAARMARCAAPFRPWCDPLPTTLPASDLGAGEVGLLDLPDTQQQRPWSWAATDGHLIVAGAHGTGVTSTLLQAVSANLDASTEVAVIDARGDDRWAMFDGHPRCAGVVRLHERERLIRVLASHAATSATSLPTPPVRRVLVVDGIAALRLELEAVELSDTRLSFERVLTDASLGVSVVVGTDAPAAVPPALVSRCASRWVHHLADAHDALVLGVAAADVPAAAVPGRVAVARGRDVAEGQVALVDPDRLRARPGLPPVERVRVLDDSVDAARIGRAIREDGLLSLPVGARFDTCGPATLDVADGEHVLIVGPVRSGRSTVLVRVVRAWTDVHPVGWVGVVAPRRSPLAAFVTEPPNLVVEQVPPTGPALLVVDDAELVDDPSGVLTRLVGCRRPGLLVVAAGRPESLRGAYGHWTTGVRRSRLGVVMAGATDMDADLLGATLPRWAPIAPRPGLAYVVADGSEVLVQCAVDLSVPTARRSRRRRRAERSRVGGDRRAHWWPYRERP